MNERCDMCHRPEAVDKAAWRADRGATCGRHLKWASNAAYADCYLFAYERLNRELSECRCLKPSAVTAAMEGRSQREAAKMLGVPKSTLNDYLKRATPCRS